MTPSNAPEAEPGEEEQESRSGRDSRVCRPPSLPSRLGGEGGIPRRRPWSALCGGNTREAWGLPGREAVVRFGLKHVLLGTALQGIVSPVVPGNAERTGQPRTGL